MSAPSLAPGSPPADLYPTLARWLGNRPQPLHPLTADLAPEILAAQNLDPQNLDPEILAAQNLDPQNLDPEILAALEAIVSGLDLARPLRLPEKRRVFRGLRSIDALIEMRAEMSIGAALARAGVPFALGRPGDPDYLMQTDHGEIGIEVGTRRLDGPWRLREHLQTLTPPGARVMLDFNGQPLKVTDSETEQAVQLLSDLVAAGGGVGRVPSLALQLTVQYGAHPTAGETGQSVHLQFRNELGVLNLTDDATVTEQEIANKAQGKDPQSLVRPTALLIDIGRVGLSSLHTAARWAPCLDQLAVSTTHHFEAVGVFMSDLRLDRPTEVAVAQRQGDSGDPVVELLARVFDLDDVA